MARINDCLDCTLAEGGRCEVHADWTAEVPAIATGTCYSCGRGRLSPPKRTCPHGTHHKVNIMTPYGNWAVYLDV